MGNIQTFYQNAKANDFARDFQFRIVALGPFTESDLVYLTTAILPGKTISNQPVPYMGLDFNIPGSVKYDGSAAWQVTFRCDESLNIHTKMENWIKTIFDDQTSTGNYNTPREISSMDLLDKNFNATRRYNFIGMYPVTLGVINYDIKGAGTPLEFPCTFAYQYYRLV